MLHVPQNIADAFGFRYIDDVLGNFRQLCEFAAHEPEKVLVGNHANDVVHVLFVHRKAGKVVAEEQLLRFLHCGI